MISSQTSAASGDELRMHLEELERRLVRSVSPAEFLTLLYGDGRIVITTSSTETEKGSCRVLSRDEAVEFLATRSNAYVYPATFFGNYPRKELLKNLIALVVDLDDVEFAGLKNLLDEFDRTPEVRPSYIVKTGGGYHLWYLLTDPIEYRKRWSDKLEAINRSLYDFWSMHAGGCVCDRACCSIPHGFRPPGSLNKIGGQTLCYQVDSIARTDIIGLADFFGVELTSKNGGTIDFKPIADDDARRKRSNGSRRKFAAKKGSRSEKLYEWTLGEIPHRTLKGNRYLSMFCLSGIAYDCGIPRERLREDLERLVQQNWASGSHPVKRHEIDNAMRGYCPEYASLRKSTRESMLGWHFGPSQKRNYGASHKSREEHIREVHKSRRVKSINSIVGAISENPDACKAEIARISGLSYPTVLKYYELAKGIADGIGSL